MNSFGIIIGMATLFIIGLGFPLVILGERYLGYLWWPYVLGTGLLTILASLFIQVDWQSALTGVLGATLLWGATELNSQAGRVAAGWFPVHPQKVKPPFEATIRRLKAPKL